MTSELETIDRLTHESTTAAAEKLQELEHSATVREIRKAARKALYVLSLRGILPSKIRKAYQTAPPGAARIRTFSTAFDGAGNRLLLFLIPDADGGSSGLIQILTNDIEGVKDFEMIRISRRDVDERIEKLTSQLETGLAVAEIEPDYTRWLLSTARAISASQSKSSPRGLLGWMPKIGEPDADYASPIYSKISPDEIRNDVSISHDPKELFRLIWFEPWFYAADETMPWLPEWEQLTSDEDEATAAERQIRIDAIVSEAANALMPETMRTRYINRLAETADVLWRCGKEPEAKMAAFHSLELATAPESEPAAIPFAREIAYRTLGAALEMARLYREQRASDQ